MRQSISISIQSTSSSSETWCGSSSLLLLLLGTTVSSSDVARNASDRENPLTRRENRRGNDRNRPERPLSDRSLLRSLSDIRRQLRRSCRRTSHTCPTLRRRRCCCSGWWWCWCWSSLSSTSRISSSLSFHISFSNSFIYTRQHRHALNSAALSRIIIKFIVLLYTISYPETILWIIIIIIIIIVIIIR